MEIVERIAKLVDEKTNGNKKEFSSIIGVVQVTFNRYINKERSIGVDAISGILSAFPEVSAEWLLRGKGEMIITETSPINVDGDLNTIDMENKLRKTEALLDAVIEQNERLKAELAEYKARETQSKGIA